MGANHGYLQKVFLNCGDKLGILIGQPLQELHSSRIDADYRLESADQRSVPYAMSCVGTARDIESRLKQLHQIDEQQRIEIREAMKSFRTRVKR